jgi:hypothetical protein
MRNPPTFTAERVSILKLTLIALVVLSSVYFLAGCQTKPTGPVTFEDILTQSTIEITAAANTLADARDAGIVDPTSERYQKAKASLLDAQTYIELAWTYYAGGELEEAQASRRLAVGSYQIVRPMLVDYQKRLEGN